MAEQKKDDKAATSSKVPATNTLNGQQSHKDIPSLGALDEDDEFEDFEAQGEYI